MTGSMELVFVQLGGDVENTLRADSVLFSLIGRPPVIQTTRVSYGLSLRSESEEVKSPEPVKP
jgi:hypothetical protein